MAKTILSITLNPAVDKSSTANHIQPEKKIRCSQPVYEPGGGGINVSRALLRLGITSTALFSKGGRTGELLENLLKKEGVTTLPVETSAETRENFIVVDTANNNQFRFGMPGEKITTADADALRKAILNASPSPDIAVISGSLPDGISTGWLTEIVRELKSKNVKIIADTSGDALTEILNEGVHLIKPNLGELSRLSGMEELDNDSADEAAKKLINEGKAEIVAVSMGPQGAYLVSKEECVHVPAPSVKKLSTVGAGDSMVAGMVSVIAKGGSLTEIARMGVACGTAATMSKGTGLFTKENAEKLYQWLSK
ncbi:1-phosphofructokinase family hexose kinase [Flavobacterium sp. AG291]|uniref:1-phosphofructokinase family hexose kinase n=1 Tax=Flavobacterium sp. AG291 TaxID=2184000 RepID=UPI000E0CA08D|nr:1-phosphofructokinase family hexose kinase [Flavobacterium sp. AG291]RDI06944.1 6-phosphofructokinase 2 [Flavobacterium sp. AG291]